MRRYLLDSGPLGDFVYDRNGVRLRVLALRRAGGLVATATPIVGELMAGAEMSNDPDRHRKVVWRELGPLKKWPFEVDAARVFGRLRAVLDRLGRSMQQIDVQLAAIALARGSTTVVTYDSDLAAVPGLSVENWLKTP